MAQLCGVIGLYLSDLVVLASKSAFATVSRRFDLASELLSCLFLPPTDLELASLVPAMVTSNSSVLYTSTNYISNLGVVSQFSCELVGGTPETSQHSCYYAPGDLVVLNAAGLKWKFRQLHGTKVQEHT